MDISAVIPTYNRPDSLLRTLSALARQTHGVKETIIVFSGDKPAEESVLREKFPPLNICLRSSGQSVCVQRNAGISMASYPYILILDDDVELSENYLASIATCHRNNLPAGAFSGLVLEKDKNGIWKHDQEIVSFRSLLWRFIFQLSLFTELEKYKPDTFTYLPFSLIRKFYSLRKNHVSLAGWPLLTDMNSPSTIYALGASVVKREWLLLSPFEEVLDTHGIGENYGVALNFPQKQSIHIVSETSAFHYKTPSNRHAYELAYFRRVLALDYFMRRHHSFNWVNRMFLLWSLKGNMLSGLFRMNFTFVWVNIKLGGIIFFGRNPYTLAKMKGLTVVCPQL